MSVSTVPAVKARLVTLLAAAAGLSGVKITWTFPVDEDDIGIEHIHFGDVEQDETWHSIGGQSREEDYTLEVVVLAKVFGDDPRATDTRLWTLREEVAAVIRSDPSMNNILKGSAEVSATRTDMQPLTDGWAARARLSVHCRALI